MSTDDERTKVDDDEDSKNNNNNFLTKRLRSPGKIPLSSEFLNRLLGCVYFCIFTEFIEDGLQALDEIHSRAKSELYSDVLLVRCFYRKNNFFSSRLISSILILDG